MEVARIFPTISHGNQQYWHVDICTGCFEIALALASDLESAEDPADRLAVVLNVLDSSLIPRCGPEPDLLPFYGAVLDTAKDLTWLVKNRVSEYHRNKSLSWLESFPAEYAKETSQLKIALLALLT
ncbi:hypothetical protein V5O48_017637 [Marasmius crinis-equi]|uniref:Uncharacterized protein n=1 Tax=Marasmius crinis-equi TaxID=585013 RepID=A0ABR3ENH2_9AGAR